MTKPWMSGDGDAIELSVGKGTVHAWSAVLEVQNNEIVPSWKIQTTKFFDWVCDNVATNTDAVKTGD